MDFLGLTNLTVIQTTLEIIQRLYGRTKLFTLSPVIVPPLSDSVPVTVRLPTFAEAILELANVFAPEKIFVFARYAIEEVPESWLIEIPDTVPVTFRLPGMHSRPIVRAPYLFPKELHRLRGDVH
jgi:hypothetical protein